MPEQEVARTILDAEETEPLIEALDRLGVPTSAGRIACQQALQQEGITYRLRTLSAAVKARRLTADEASMFGSLEPEGGGDDG